MIVLAVMFNHLKKLLLHWTLTHSYRLIQYDYYSNLLAADEMLSSALLSVGPHLNALRTTLVIIKCTQGSVRFLYDVAWSTGMSYCTDTDVPLFENPCCCFVNVLLL
jgi:hypothetical protein